MCQTGAKIVLMKTFRLLAAGAALFVLTGCLSPHIALFPDYAQPLKEQTLQGVGRRKVLLIHVKGFISDEAGRSFFQTKPSVLQEFVSQLKKAEDDQDVKAVVLQVNTPGGTTTASDILYEEIVRFKRKTGVKIVAALMDVAASGGYYISLPADSIFAHPTTVTGSVGVLFVRPKVVGLMDKVGMAVEINKSGKNKDMGSPFRVTTAEENEIIQGLINELGARFLNLVAERRKIDNAGLAQISTGRVYLASEALHAGLVDKIGYLDDAIAHAKTLADLPSDAKVVVYRRTEFPDDNAYNTSIAQLPDGQMKLIDISPFDSSASLPVGFYYLWLPAGASS